MKRYVLMLAVLLISCSGEDNEKDVANTFPEPFIDFNATEAEVIELFGEPWIRRTSSRIPGYELLYKSEIEGVFHIGYEFKYNEILYATNVYIGSDSMESMLKKLEATYGPPEITDHMYRYYTDTTALILNTTTNLLRYLKKI